MIRKALIAAIFGITASILVMSLAMKFGGVGYPTPYEFGLGVLVFAGMFFSQIED